MCTCISGVIGAVDGTDIPIPGPSQNRDLYIRNRNPQFPAADSGGQQIAE